MTNNKLAISMMSGTSLDGVDAVLVRIFSDLKVEVVAAHHMEYDRVIREKLYRAANNESSTSDICVLNFMVAKQFAKCALELLMKAQVSRESVDFISSHGQTIYHIPYDVTLGQVQTKSTLQIGDISVIAHQIGVPVVGDFRPKDMAAGGLGAPLVPFADEIIFGREVPRIIQNLGGIANMTVLSPNVDTFGFDSGPANMLIDYYVRKFFDKPYDENGEIALSGCVDEAWLNEFLKEPFYFEKPPKTTGRELFNDEYAEKMLQNAPQKPEDVIATVTKLTARTVFNAYKDFVEPKIEVKEVVLGGGGAYNKALFRFFVEDFKEIHIRTHEEFGIDNRFKEAIAFALLGYHTYMRLSNNLPECTGAKERVIMGKIAY